MSASEHSLPRFWRQGREAAGDEEVECALIREEDLVGGPRRHQFNVNAVVVIIVQHQHVTGVGGGTGGEAAGLIGIDLACCTVT